MAKKSLTIEVIECKNINLQKMAKVMLHVKNLPYYFWVEAMNEGSIVSFYEIDHNFDPFISILTWS